MRKSKGLAGAGATAAQKRRTEVRRVVQPLWTALDATCAAFWAEGALLCVSGGPDSRTLLEVIARWPTRFEGPVRVASVDHGTRLAARAEAEAVAARAHALGFDAAVLTPAVRGQDEAALRAARYQALCAHARAHGLGSLVLAHHRGDAAEGPLLALLGEGGGALRAVSHVGGLRLLRPFLGLPKSALALARTALGVRGELVDPDRRSARARLRAELLPGVSRPALLEERAAALAARRADDEDTLLPMAAALLDASGASLVVRAGPPALMRRALKEGLSRLLPHEDTRASSPAIERALMLVRAARRGEIHLAGGVAALVGPGEVRLERRAERSGALADGAVPAYAPPGTAPRAGPGTEDS